MPARKVNFDRLHEIELEYLIPRFGNGSIWETVDDEVYKLAKEYFVSNLDGTTFMEVLIVISIIPLSFFTCNLIRHIFQSYFSTVPLPFQFLYEFVCFIIPSVFIFAPGSENQMFIYIVIFGSQLMLIAYSKLNYSSLLTMNMNDFTHDNKQKAIFITHYRTTLMLLTMISILSVDFTIFPRRFAKCEMNGFSVMDLGVGSFIFALGIVSPSISIKYYSANNRLKHAFKFCNCLKIFSFTLYFRSSFPMLVLGIGRCLLTTSFNYQTHVSEYGTQWNFFITVAVITFIANILQIPFLTQLKYSHKILLLGINILLSIVYQYFLCNSHITHYILYAERNGFFSANREGIISCVGFFILFNFGVLFGTHSAILYEKRLEIEKKSQVMRYFFQLILLEMLIFLCGYFCHSWIQPTSRRFTNLAYIFFVIGCNLWIILLFLGCVLCFTRQPSSIILVSISKNQLFIFLVANVFTGIINLVIKTLFANALIAYSIVISYLFVLCGIAFILYSKNVRLLFAVGQRKRNKVKFS